MSNFSRYLLWEILGVSLKISMYGNTDVGCLRKTNQDAIGFDSRYGFGIVADGIGGRPGGDIASRMVVDGLTKAIEKADHLRFDEISSFMLSQVDMVNLNVLNYGQTNTKYLGLGTTLNFLYFIGNNLHLAHVGDSRTYLFYKEHFFQVTVDHNLGTFMKRGLIEPSAVNAGAKSAALMRAVGLRENLEVDLLKKETKPGEIYITASDGLFDMVEDTTIRRIVSEYQNKLDQLPSRLISEANRAGGKDNITVLVSKVAA